MITTDTCERFIVDLNAGFAAAHAEQQAAFQKQWDKKIELKSFLAAGAEAQKAVAEQVVDGLHARLDELCRYYFQATEIERGEVRRLVGVHKDLLRAMQAHISWVSERISAPTDIDWLRSGLLAASIEDNRTDYRDMYMALGHLYVTSAKAGIEPEAEFQRIAAISNVEPSYLMTAFKGSSMKAFLADFTASAHFAASVAPLLK